MAKPKPTKRTRPSTPPKRTTGPGRGAGPADTTGPGPSAGRDQAWNRHTPPARGFNPGFKRR